MTFIFQLYPLKYLWVLSILWKLGFHNFPYLIKSILLYVNSECQINRVLLVVVFYNLESGYFGCNRKYLLRKWGKMHVKIHIKYWSNLCDANKVFKEVIYSYIALGCPLNIQNTHVKIFFLFSVTIQKYTVVFDSFRSVYCQSWACLRSESRPWFCLDLFSVRMALIGSVCQLKYTRLSLKLWTICTFFKFSIK